MPSLEQLEEFKASFHDIGNEAVIMSRNPMLIEDFELPEDNPPLSFPEGLGNIPVIETKDIPIADDLGLDFPNDILSGFTDDLEAGGFPIDETPSMVEEIPDFSPEAEDYSDTTSSEPFADEPLLTSAAEAPVDQSPSDFSNLEFPEIDLSDALDMGGETSTSPQAAAEEFSGLPVEGDDSFNLDFPGDIDSSNESGFDTGSFDTGGFDTGGFDDGVESTEPTELMPEPSDELPDSLPESADFSDSAGDFGIDGSVDFGSDDISSGFDTDFPSPEPMEEADTGTEGTDSFDDFTSGSDWNIPDTKLETPDFSAPASDDFGDFSLPGYDTGEGKRPEKTRVPGPAESFGPSPEYSPEIEEINLREKEFEQLQDTLSSYPLNLRIACEELIAEQAVDPDQMSELIKLLVRGAPVKETASLAGKILGKQIPIPKGYEKQTGEELEAEQASFGYIFKHRLLPVLRIAGVIAIVAGSLGFLIWRFAVIPFQAERRYKEGYALIQSGEYITANERFRQGFEIHRVKKWFYRYAEAFRDERQYIYAQRKYDELLRIYPKDKKGALDYAAMETYYIRNYEKADRIIRTNILDYSINDREGLLALAENALAWGEIDPGHYEDARYSYARLIEKYGRKDPYLEGMLKYFIRTDKLGEVLVLQSHFMGNPKKHQISVPTLAELGGYLLDKVIEEKEGVPDEFADRIDGIRDVLIRALVADRNYPETYYHLARYYLRYGSVSEERQSLKEAIRAFEAASEESAKRVTYHIDAQRLYAEMLINSREFFPAEEELIRGVRLYEDARARGVLKNPSPEFGRLYADLGDLEFFIKSGDMNAALRFYEEAERNNYSPPEIQYRIGAAHYQNEQWEEALQRFFVLTSVMPTNRRLLYALGNASYLRGNYFTAQSYYTRLLDILDTDRVRFPNLTPGSGSDEQDLAERIMVANNNLGVTLEALTRVTGNTGYRTRALYLFSESLRAWDVLTRDPGSMARMQPMKDLYGPGVNLAYLNTQNILYPIPSYEQQIFLRIDRDSQEPSDWEMLVPRDYRLLDQLSPGER